MWKHIKDFLFAFYRIRFGARCLVSRRWRVREARLDPRIPKWELVPFKFEVDWYLQWDGETGDSRELPRRRKSS